MGHVKSRTTRKAKTLFELISCKYRLTCTQTFAQHNIHLHNTTYICTTHIHTYIHTTYTTYIDTYMYIHATPPKIMNEILDSHITI